MLVPVVEFFDDFTVLQPANLGSSGSSSLQMLLKFCGWKIAGDKLLDFSGEFVSVGAQENLMHLQTASKIIVATSQVVWTI